MVLSWFEEIYKQEDGVEILSIGFNFTTKNIMYNNMLGCYRVMNDEGIILCIDGTWRLVINGWPLLIIGTDFMNTENEHSHSFAPFGFCFCRAETEKANIELISSIIAAFKKFILEDIEANFNVIGGILDHSNAIRNALLHCFPHIVIMSCWAHVLRNARIISGKRYDVRDDKNVIIGKEPYVTGGTATFDDLLHPIIVRIHLAANDFQFENLVAAFKRKFYPICPAFVDHFIAVNCSKEWRNWYQGASPINCLGSTANPLERYNGWIKSILDLASTITNFLNVGIVNLLKESNLKSDGIIWRSRTSYFSGGIQDFKCRLNAQILSASDDLLCAGSKGNIAQVNLLTYMRSSHHLVTECTHFNAISEQTIKQFTKFSNSIVVGSKISFEKLDVILGVHVVTECTDTGLLTCSCKHFRVFGRCSHCAAKYHMQKKLDVFSLISVLVPKKSIYLFF